LRYVLRVIGFRLREAGMRGGYPVTEAERVFRGLLKYHDDRAAPAHDEFLDAVRRFGEVDFDVAEAPDSDGFLFEYGAYRRLPRPGFVVTVLRQFEIATESGEHDYHVQLHGAYRYDIEPDLEAVVGRPSWWFRSDPEPFDEWFAQVVDDPVWRVVSGRPLLDFVVFQESV
jgi:hypothetical protein